MRTIIAASLACLLAAPAIAQDVPSQLDKAERERDAMMKGVDDAIQANDWDTACTKAKDVTAKQYDIAVTASDWVDQQDARGSLTEEDYNNLSVRVTLMWQAHTQLAEAETGICAKAAE